MLMEPAISPKKFSTDAEDLQLPLGVVRFIRLHRTEHRSSQERVALIPVSSPEVEHRRTPTYTPLRKYCTRDCCCVCGMCV